MSKIERGPTQDIPLSIVVVGASGDLAKKKTYPALFSLLYNGLLPKNVHIIGFGRTKMNNDEFRLKALVKLTCRIGSRSRCSEAMDTFYEMCTYKSGSYDSVNDFNCLLDEIKSWEGGSQSNRLIYLAVPPDVFVPSLKSLTGAFGVEGSNGGWLRVIIEKPFGHDLPSFYNFRDDINALLRQDQIYRIDHFLGKELVQNIMILRFANQLLEPCWNREHISSVQFTFKEDFGVEGRGGYFENSGIIRDILQNHLLQLLCLVAMEQPSSIDSADVRVEKLKVLRSIKSLHADDFIVGQYRGTTDPKTGSALKGYKDEQGVPATSVTPTFAACVFEVKNRRWEGVPFMMLAGKAMSERKSEVRVCFKKVPGGLFPSPPGLLDHNELIIRIQPDESIKLRLVNKVPGLKGGLEDRYLTLHVAKQEDKESDDEEENNNLKPTSPPVAHRTSSSGGASNPHNSDIASESFNIYDIPDAYEPLILDAISGNDEFFISEKELEEAWRIFTPALHEFEKFEAPAGHVIPEVFEYDYKTPWIPQADALAAKFNVRWAETVEKEFLKIQRAKKNLEKIETHK